MVAYKAHNLVVGGASPPAVTLKEVEPQRSPCFTYFKWHPNRKLGFDNFGNYHLILVLLLYIRKRI